MKFGEALQKLHVGKVDREIIGNTKLISDPKELYRFLAKPVFEVINLVLVNDEVVRVS